LKTPAQLNRESDAARRLERQRSKDCQKEQEQIKETPAWPEREPGTRKR
jgi:hypothetical protein